MIIYDMKTEDLINPIGIDEKKPRFSWKLQSKISGTVQTAYRIIVRSDNDTVWDSGKVTSDRSICIEYDGQSLSAMTKYSWQVSVWDEQGNEYTSDTADFETGLMNNELMPIGLAVRKKPSTHMPLITIKFLVLSSRTISAWL